MYNTVSTYYTIYSIYILLFNINILYIYLSIILATDKFQTNKYNEIYLLYMYIYLLNINIYNLSIVLAMDKFQTRNRVKFSRKLTNRLNRSLALISNTESSNYDSHDFDINNCITNTTNDAYDMNNSVMLHKNSCHISNSYLNVNIPCGSELYTILTLTMILENYHIILNITRVPKVKHRCSRN